ncbi:hypothetical protein [Streptomyces uncialis]|uniref:hypothetical protein n=1 Tax=Streptomyces uncialis TaxID=1048205 RepID=UPI00378F193C
MAPPTLADRTEVLAPTGLTPLLSTRELMARYGVSNWTVNEWIKRGCPVGSMRTASGGRRQRRFDLAQVEQWLTADESDEFAASA